MAGRDADRVQLDFPQLVADIIRQLNLTGTVGLLEFSDQVTPVYIVAQRAGALTFDVAAITFASATVFVGAVTDPAVATVVADTGPLPAGTYDVQGSISFNGKWSIPLASAAVSIQHRDAANAVTLAQLLILPTANTNVALATELPIVGYTIGLNERIRIETGGGVLIGGVAGTIFVQIRPTP